MDTNNQQKPVNGLPFYTLTFLVALLFELYWIFTRPYDYFMLFGIGIILVITGYLAIDTALKAHAAEIAQRQQQNDTMIKAQKAIYLATKKNAVEAEKSREQNIKTLEVIMTSMVSSQKELVNVITTKSDEFAGKQLTMSDSSVNVSELVDKLTASNDRLAKQVQEAMTINELVKANAELVKNVQGILGQSVDLTNQTFANTSTTEESAINEIPVDDISEYINPDPIMSEVDTPETEESLDAAADSVSDAFDFASTFEDMGFSDDEEVNTLDDSADAIINEINAAKMEEAEALENMTVAEDISPELDSEMSNTTTASDPNAPLSEEEIAALFASL